MMGCCSFDEGVRFEILSEALECLQFPNNLFGFRPFRTFFVLSLLNVFDISLCQSEVEECVPG
jgi:hypothetical protein